MWLKSLIHSSKKAHCLDNNYLFFKWNKNRKKAKKELNDEYL